MLRILLRDGPVLEGWQDYRQLYTSRLTQVELRRVMDRRRLTGMLDDSQFSDIPLLMRNLESGLQRLALSEAVLQRAEQPMGVVVKSLDAIHLASALLLRTREVPDLVFATHDRQQAIGARALSFDVIGVER